MCMFLLFIFDNMPPCTCCRWKTSEYICSLKNTQPLVIISTRKLILRSIYALHQVRHTCWVKECVGYSSFMSYVLHLKKRNCCPFEGNEISLPHLEFLFLSLFFLSPHSEDFTSGAPNPILSPPFLSWTFLMTYFSAAQLALADVYNRGI